MKIKTSFLGVFGDTPPVRIIDFLIDNKGTDMTKKDIIEGAEISSQKITKIRINNNKPSTRKT